MNRGEEKLSSFIVQLILSLLPDSETKWYIHPGYPGDGPEPGFGDGL